MQPLVRARSAAKRQKGGNEKNGENLFNTSSFGSTRNLFLYCKAILTFFLIKYSATWCVSNNIQTSQDNAAVSLFEDCRTIWHWTIWHQELKTDNLASGQFYTRTIWHQEFINGQFDTRTICHQKIWFNLLNLFCQTI